jgi:acetyltransferase-like isoleucine patch superfamily enzyme
MKKWIKNKLIKYLRSLNEILTSDLYIQNNPYSIQFRDHARIGYPFKIGNGNRIFIGENSYVGKQAWLEVYGSHGEIKIEDNVCIGNFACITAIQNIRIKKGTLVSEHFYVSDHTHGFDPEDGRSPLDQPLSSRGGVEIGENCFIGYRVSILPGVTLGKNCVVGTHSVVTRSFPDFTMIAGIPAKAIKKFNFLTSNWESIANENE